VLKLGTSIGANIREAKQTQSRNYCVAKLNISLKESNESAYWIDLLFNAGYLDKAKK
jgi:four helix bundle protein